MSVPGMSKDDWVAKTYCDFNSPSRKEVLRTHFSVGAAARAFSKILKIYAQYGRCWQETREGEIINDSNYSR